MGIIADHHPGLYKVVEAAGVAHSKGMQSYLCMIGIRLLEMRRLLKPTGSIYVHCDSTASHYLKLVMDSIFGAKNFKNDVVWRYGGSARGAKAIAKHFAKNHDDVLYYVKDQKTAMHNPVYGERKYSLTDLPSHIRHEDGRYFKTAPRGDYTDDSIRRLRESGRIHETRNGNLRVKYFLECDGDHVIEPVLAGSVWDIPDMMHAPTSERQGYPTQKPLALLSRVITAGSNPGDVVLDPFCGCATALVAAEHLGRQWVGIDISEMAVKLVRHRLYREVPLFTQDAIDRSDVPRRTDLVDEIREYQNDKHVLYGQQEGHCNGCGGTFEFRNLEVDHVVPRAKGGADHISNYQLLCGFCNRTKGTGSQAELLAKLKRDGIIAAA